MEFFIVNHYGHGGCESYHRTFKTPEAASEFGGAYLGIYFLCEPQPKGVIYG